MKSRFLPFLLIALVFTGAGYYINTNSIDQAYLPVEKRQEIAKQGINGAAEYMAEIRNNQVTGIADPSDVLKAKSQVMEMTSGKSANAELSWVEMGPDNIGGRTRSIIVDNQDPTYKTLIIGSVSGGLWKSETAGTSWIKIEGFSENLAVSAMAQASNGDIYVGTGEGLYHFDGTGTGGFIGNGLYKSTDGVNFTSISSTVPETSNNQSMGWAQINELAISPVSGKVFASTGKGLRVSNDGGNTWYNPIVFSGTSSPNEQISTDVNIALDGTILAVVGNDCYLSTTGEDGSFTCLSGSGAGMLPDGSMISRLEVAIAPSNSNYMYAAAAAKDGKLYNVYRSTDKGTSWEIIAPGGSPFFEPFSGQGSYNNTLAVFPDNENEIILGGIDLYHWSTTSSWEKRSFWSFNPTSPNYVHADHHKYVFHPSNPSIFYLGTDGGISRSEDRAQTFVTFNKNYNVTQFYSVNFSKTGKVIGGTQDNGTIYISQEGNSVLAGSRILGGDGGYCAISHLNPDVFFSTIYNGATYRTFDYTNQEMWTSFKPGPAAKFVTPIQLWESANNTQTVDSVYFVAEDQSYNGSELVNVKSSIPNYTFPYTIPYPLAQGDSVQVQDPITSVLYYGAVSGDLYMNKKALDGSLPAATLGTYWVRLTTGTNWGQISTFAISNDGNTAIIGCQEGKLFRMTGLNKINNTITQSNYTEANNLLSKKELVSYPDRYVTSISIDPNDANRVIATLGNYGNTEYVYFSENALSDNPTFTSVQGNLPAMPVYSSLIEMNNPNYVIIGTEYGLFSTEDITANPVVWQSANNGMYNVPVLMIKQQTMSYIDGVTNYGSIYIATHGRGIFRSDAFVSVPETINPSEVLKQQNTVKVFPNPVSSSTNLEFNLKSRSNVEIEVYNLSGQIVKSVKLGNCNEGINNTMIDASNLIKGNYIIRIKAGNQNIVGRFVVVR